VIRLLTAVSLAGLALFIFGPNPVLAFGGAALWGLGIWLGFPVGMSAGADDPARSAARVSVVATIGYLAFLGGPPLIGFLGDRTTVLRAFTTVATLLALALLITGNLRPVASSPATADVPPER
jgi:cyanate permease